MAEVVGLAASIITIAALSGTMIKVSKTMRKAAKSAPLIREEISRTAVLFESSGRAIEASHTVLARLGMGDDDSKLVGYLTNRGLLSSLDKSIAMVLRRLDGCMDEVQSVESRFSIITFLRWESRKASLSELSIQVECVKTTITMVMLIVKLECNVLDAARTTDEVYRSRLEQDNQALTKTLDQQRKMTKTLRRECRRIQDVGVADSMPILAAMDLFEILSRRELHHNNRWSVLPTPSPTPRDSPPAPVPAPVPSPAPASASDIEARWQEWSTPGPSSRRAQSRYRDTRVRNHNQIITVDPSRVERSVDGYLSMGPYGGTHVTALTGGLITGPVVNVMSRHRARGLYLKPRVMDNADPTALQWGVDGPYHAFTGMVSAWWRPRQVDARPVCLDFYLVENMQPDIVLRALYSYKS